jgi:DNA-binding MarR family transcriptional regulator
MRRSPKTESDRQWSLLTPHAHVLLCIARDPDSRVWEIAEHVGISERGAHQIVADLVTAGYVKRARVGRRNRYAIEEKSALEQGPVHHRKIASIVALLGPEPANGKKAVAPAPSSKKRLTVQGKNGKRKSSNGRLAIAS